jgi:hypothetical protein
MEGYISIHRKIKEHWICDNPAYFQAWLFMLMTVNFKDGSILLGSKKYVIKRGQSSMSIRSWANEFKMSTKAVDTFFKLLEEENMIIRKTLGKGKHSTTLITINNYDQYQYFSETLEKRNGIARETLEKHEGDARGVQYNNDNNANNVNNDNKAIPTLEEFVDYAKSKKPKVKIEEVRLKYNAWIENDWSVTRKGKIEKIQNWKTTLCNTLPHMNEESIIIANKIAV